MTDKYIEELRDVIRKLHGVDSRHLESLPVKDVFNGQVVWDGVVEVFELVGHKAASKVYAWRHETGNPKKPIRHVTILHRGIVRSPLVAVRVSIVREYDIAEEG